MNENEINYYAIIPANVRYDTNLKPNEKLLYGEITALSNQKGFCYAQNQYFAKLFKYGRGELFPLMLFFFIYQCFQCSNLFCRNFL